MVLEGAQATGITAALRGLSSKGRSKMWGSLTSSGLGQESVHQEPTHRRIQDITYNCPIPRVKRLLNQSLTWAKERK